ncbi:hypothetical protein PLICRDRAFT_45702 [Plicaturopsis crispa FD-325 SS-3]|uniref:Uncharacterized protein n=1 Tax=Plicaturopsis crispa FD-325 SS-3 TaxID=944288 RepID=A0A0C9SRP0_PLICR|nr:hypothetical protein PLICRDRAFT_45702 [Plicaturopsis crispa FD-325 SS-3]
MDRSVIDTTIELEVALEATTGSRATTELLAARFLALVAQSHTSPTTNPNPLPHAPCSSQTSTPTLEDVNVANLLHAHQSALLAAAAKRDASITDFCSNRQTNKSSSTTRRRCTTRGGALGAFHSERKRHNNYQMLFSNPF